MAEGDRSSRPKPKSVSQQGDKSGGLPGKIKALGGSPEITPAKVRAKLNPAWLKQALLWPLQDSPLQRWIMLATLCAALAVLLFPSLLTPTPDYDLGDVVSSDIKARQAFLVEDNVSTEERRKEAESKQLTVYDFDDWLGESIINRVRQAFGLVRTRPLAWGGKLHEPGADVEPFDPNLVKEEERALKAEFQALIGTEISDQDWELLKRTGFSSEIEEALVDLLDDVLWLEIVPDRERLLQEEETGIVIRTISNNSERIVRYLYPILNPYNAGMRIRSKALSFNLKPAKLNRLLRSMVARLASDLVRPNLTPNRHETEKRRKAARDSVKPVYYRVLKGEMVAREGQIVTHQILARLKRETETRPAQLPWLSVLGMFLLLGVFLRSLYMPILYKMSDRRIDGKDLAFASSTILLIFILARILQPPLVELAQSWGLVEPQILIGALPIAAGAMLVCVFLGMESAFLAGLALSFLAAHMSEFKLEAFALYLASSLIGARSIIRMRNRGTSLRAGFMAGLTGMMVVFAIRLSQPDMLSLATLAGLGAALLGGFLAGVIVSGLIPLVEILFGYTTDFRLLEMANLDHPVLKELLFQAPGSYHHSIVVGNMVEAAAESIGANPLLAKVAAYYHDVGKISKPLYFVENQINGENRHEKLAPSMSALILIAHVKRGIEIAREAKLGKRIEDIIGQHHGTSLIKYFYDKAINAKGDKEQVKEEDFRYPGPKPQTKEAGLVMLADQVEAATKSLSEPTPSRVQGLVNKIINGNFTDDQLSDCQLTLQDLHSIAKSFNQVLNGIFHQRVAYPEPPTKDAKAKRKTNGDSDPKRTDKGGPGSDRDSKEGKDNLRRLGIS